MRHSAGIGEMSGENYLREMSGSLCEGELILHGGMSGKGKTVLCPNAILGGVLISITWGRP